MGVGVGISAWLFSGDGGAAGDGVGRISDANLAGEGDLVVSFLDTSLVEG